MIILQAIPLEKLNNNIALIIDRRLFYKSHLTRV
jgi:hypothetical protein